MSCNVYIVLHCPGFCTLLALSCNVCSCPTLSHILCTGVQCLHCPALSRICALSSDCRAMFAVVLHFPAYCACALSCLHWPAPSCILCTVLTLSCYVCIVLYCPALCTFLTLSCNVYIVLHCPAYCASHATFALSCVVHCPRTVVQSFACPALSCIVSIVLALSCNLLQWPALSCTVLLCISLFTCLTRPSKHHQWFPPLFQIYNKMTRRFLEPFYQSGKDKPKMLQKNVTILIEPVNQPVFESICYIQRLEACTPTASC
jgi:hypothetical protein